MKLFWHDSDYNLILEKILDSKYFSSNTKSLLFSMIYKLEEFYTDYQMVKNIDSTKNEFLNFQTQKKTTRRTTITDSFGTAYDNNS